MTRSEKETPATAVERALGILEAVAQRSGGMSNADISRRLEIPKSSASYILRALEKNGYVRRGEDGRYHLGLKVLNLSRHALAGIDVREIALPVMRDLMHRSQLTVHLAILDGDEAVYIEKVDSPGFIKMDTWVGKRMEIHTTGVGKALIAYEPEEKVHRIAQERGLRKVTPKSITAVQRFMKELEHVREVGYGIDDEENSLGVRCLGAPIFGEGDRVEAAIGVSATVNQVPREAVPRYSEMVKEAARKISAQLGWRPHLHR
ncbi:MAG TPA: IclR family transcriptional regulator [Terriglobales bacterium]|nr:IclR family transcriptional regulator [Terriglobales bacterium]